MFGTRLADVRNKFHLPPHLRMANFEKGQTSSDSIQKRAEDNSSLNAYALSLFDPSITWKDIKWLKSITSLPIVVKGVLTSEDAELAVEANVNAILVSNHGKLIN